MRKIRILCHTCEVKTVGAAHIRALQRAATAGYEVEKVSQALEDVSAEKSRIFYAAVVWEGKSCAGQLHVSGGVSLAGSGSSTPAHVAGTKSPFSIRRRREIFYSTRLLQLSLSAVYTSWKASPKNPRRWFTHVSMKCESEGRKNSSLYFPLFILTSVH